MDNNPDLHMLREVKKFVDATFEKAGLPDEIQHLARTLHWVEQLKPNADKALQIAAYSHDIERAFRVAEGAHDKHTFADPTTKQIHQERGGKIMKEFLTARGASWQLAARVEQLIAKHEDGGDEDQTVLREAVSLSFFEEKASTYMQKHLAKLGKDGIKKKFDYMYERVTSPRAKEMTKPLYENAIKLLG